MIIDDLPEPGTPEFDTPIEPELERVLAWFIARRRRIAWAYGFDKIYCAPQDTHMPPEFKSRIIEFKVYGE